MSQQKKYDIFISYSRKDYDEVKAFVDMLKERIPTIDVWMDLKRITVADEFDEKIISAIDASSYVIFAVSPNSNSIGEGSSKWTKKELVYAQNTNKKVIPVLLNGAKLNSWFLFEFGRTDCIDTTDTLQVEKLIENLSRLTNKPTLEEEYPELFFHLSDTEKRIKYLEEAAQNGSGGALINLAHIYEYGEGVERDIDKAIDRYRRAIVHHGHTEFVDDIRALIKEKESKTKEVKSQPIHLIQPISVNGVSFNMIKVIGGTFTIGATSEQESENPWDDERPAHEVAVADYMIGETAVTQALWEAVMGVSIQEQSKKGTLGSSLRGVGANYPMYHISWDDSQEFVTRLSQLTGKTFRLPTEAEWEFAARGGNQGKGFKYAGSDTLGDVAWHDDGQTFETSPVAQKQPNELGLYDMSGNVWEWCQDWYINYGVELTPAMLKSAGMSHVTRGGSWNRAPRFCRVSVRGHSTPNERVNYVGLRVVMEMEGI